MSHVFSHSANQFWMLEAALRSLVMGSVIFAVLKLLRIRQVRAQRTAWVLALLAAVAMPTLVRWPIATRWQIPVSVPAMRAAADRQIAPAMIPASSVSQTLAARSPHSIVQPMRTRELETYQARSQARPQQIVRPIELAPTASQLHPVKQSSRLMDGLTHLLSYAAELYFLIAALLLVRLAIGLGLTLRLLRRATPVQIAAFAQQDVRISQEIKTPVTIGSSIVLPSASSTWDEAKLEIVLAHESAHVEQSDFHVHLLAGVHCALFWFSPFSWWLQRKLSALGEALSDLAALQQAESRSSYAEVLLEFAMPARPPASAIAMARASGLRLRIERLLNDRLFHEAFTGTRRHPFLAASVVPLALLASASLVSVHAAQAPVAPAPPIAAPAAVPSPAQAIPAPPEKPSAVEPISAVTEAAPVLPVAETQDEDQESEAQALAELSRAEALQHADNLRELQKEVAPLTRQEMREQAAAARKLARASSLSRQQILIARLEANAATGHFYGNWDGDSLAYVTGDGSIHFSGNYDEHFKDLRHKIQGDFIYYQHAGKAYVIQDPALLAQAKTLYAPIEALGKQQEELGRQQEALGVKQEALGKQQEQVRVPTPDFTRELAQLDQLTAKMKALQGAKTVDQESLSELEEKMGDIQGRLGELQGQAGEQRGKLGEQQGVLGEQQGKLGEEQGKLGEQQGKLSEEAQRKLKPLIEKAIRDGVAKPVE